MRTTLTSLLVFVIGCFDAKAAQTKLTTNNALTANPVSISVGGANAAGTSAAFAPADHVHSCPMASASVSGCLSLTDWNIFNSKTGPTGQVVVVTDYPFLADATGANDASTAVSNAAASLPSTGGTLYFPCGIFKGNYTFTKAVSVKGCGSGSVSSGTGGTKLVPNDLTKPVMQFGDGTVTTVRGFSVKDIILVGDGTTTTSDGMKFYGARDGTIINVVITAFGRYGYWATCNSATTASTSGIHFIGGAISAGKNNAIRVEACAGANFTSDITFSDTHVNAGSLANTHAVYLDSAEVRFSNSYLDVHDAVTGGGILMVKSFTGFPFINAANTTFDNADGNTAVTLDVSTIWTAANRLATAIRGPFTINGQVKYSDATVPVYVTRSAALLQPWLANASVFNSLQFPLTEDEWNLGVNSSTISRTGTTPDTDADLVVNHAGFKLQLADGSTGFNNGLHLGTSELYKNQGSLLMWRKDSSRPTAENNAQPISWVSVAPTYGANVTIDLTLANIFLVTATNGVAFTLGNPSGSGTSVSSHGNSQSMVCIINTSGGALGVATWSANYHLAGAWVQPATGFRRCVGFTQDPAGVPWYETWRSAADIAN